ncbi:MAG: DUF1640 domain-containing protein [Nitrospirae bacterium]|nr:DUF1640 domain-containing protein [Nitrospirota bacterium]MCL4457284.1 DUF1640 domain-containing protein [Nitrospirota bacterium]MCL5978888.1 DUF1640 domain-containing protein [Nitrospirota bacterium]
MTTAVDTLKLYERLKAADLPEKAAKEIAEVIKDTVDERLVTKEYLDIRLAEVKVDIIKWVAAMLVAQAAVIAALVKLIQ